MRALTRVFGIGTATAEQLVASLPRIVKHDVSHADAQRMARALEAIGGEVEVLASRVQPVRVVVIGGEPELVLPTPEGQAQEPPRDSAPAPSRTSETLKLGTQDLASFGLSSWKAPASAPAPQAPSQPIAVIEPARASMRESLAIDPAVDAPFEVIRDAQQWLAASHWPPSSPAPAPNALPAASPAPLPLPAASVELALGADRRRVAPSQTLALPDSQPPAAAALALRSPSARARLPHRASPQVARARAAPRSVLAPINVTSSIWEQAQRRGLRNALRGHPVAGFLIVLGGTTLVFLASYAVMR